MNIRQLEIFRAVMATGSASGASEKLNLSQPAVSKSIKLSEETLGVRLFDRKGGRLIPTDEAVLIFEEIDPVFGYLKSVQARLYDIRDARRGKLRIVATPSTANSVIPVALGRYSIKRPDVKVELDIKRWENIIQCVESNTADVGVLITHAEKPSLLEENIYTGRMVCVVSCEHELSKKRAITAEDLKGERLISMPGGSPLGDLIRSSLKLSKEEVSISVETRYCNTACALAKEGLGIAIVDDLTAKSTTFSGLRQIPIEPEINYGLYLVMSKNRPESRVCAEFCNSLKQVLCEISR